MPKYLVRITEDGEQYNIRSGGGGGSYTGGTGITISNDVINHSNSVTPQPTQGLYPIVIDGQGHVSGYGSIVSNVSYFNNDAGYLTLATLPIYDGSYI